ncbi:endolytic transglycosylase MltG [Candidatus Gromoviella agglomerans]|uniref:endolytic transglycosylase MltG n=1 Tax=Candidatus Gromoviella agglomerans TaxID=2806609 RepID=UPI001E5856D9|nr:endolytic transglycosylase MltG [Candidatus Gromoviella agglomerans]
MILVEPDETINSIATKLVQHGIIFNKRLFIIYMNILHKNIQPGEYIIQKNTPTFLVVEKIQSKNSLVRKLRIPDGSTLYQVISIIENTQGLFGEMPKLDDGDILPDTYFFIYGTKKTQLILNMKNAMNKFVKNAFQNYITHIQNSKNFEKYINVIKNERDLIILASIIEKECIPIEMPIVAGVFINRLVKNMRLQACSTTKNSLYNTYNFHGLPKNPICNPSKAAIDSVANFSFHDFMYFRLNSDTHLHIFSRDFRKHVKAGHACKSRT